MDDLSLFLSSSLFNLCSIQTPDVPDEKVDGINSNQIPESLSNAVRMDLEGGFVLQKIAHDCNFFR